MAVAYIVDEDETSISLLESQLSTLGYFDSIQILAHTESFCAAFIADRPAIVFVNFDMPLLKGALLYQELIQNNIPFVCMTTKQDAYKAAFSLEAFDCLTIPFQASRLMETVRKYIHYRKVTFC